ncbi:hypothetical protein BU25DRAFT_414270 [Macroventuria anomochaeta]|uniref:Uncharacterized protein n=1 Tax=Macroventuria anomochaeta TaxID=301207 RepID=A0ACB6RRE8_9PLEO|nr:uncharacterized protein BU25DRAFT_414270 [Macroventuria anomochaeta]KAF2623512.1 hypothetical protein BU25DRAFT_414270 [Macroventuria anomochaeta]
MSHIICPRSQQLLHDRTFQALVIENTRRARINALQQRLNALEHDLAIEAAETQLSLEAFAKSECRSLTDMFMIKFPRELRDMVYRHLSTKEERIDSDYFRSTMDPITKCYSYDQARWKTAHFPEHFWSTDYVDAEFVRELSEAYYSTSKFIFGDGQGLIGKFLNTDQLGLGFPPKELVSNIEVRLSAITHDRGSFRAYIFGVPKPPERLQAALLGLMELKSGSSVCIQFSTEAKCADERRELFVGALPVLFPKMQVAALAGYKFKYVLDRKYVFRLEGDVLKNLEEELWDIPDYYNTGGSSFRAAPNASPFSPYTD